MTFRGVRPAARRDRGDLIISPRATPDAELRASLLSAIVRGVIIERYLVRLGRLADVPPNKIIDLLRPCFRTLVKSKMPQPTTQLPTDA